MNKTVEIWEQSGLLDELDEKTRLDCANKMEAMKRFLFSPGYTSLNVEDLQVEPLMVMYPIVMRMVVKEVNVDSLSLTKAFIEFCRENQNKPKYTESDDPEAHLTFDFCEEYAK